MAKKALPSTSEPIVAPIPVDAIEQLAKRLGRRAVKGWDKCPPKTVTPAHLNPALVKGAWFDVDAVVDVYLQFKELRHTKTRRWANKPLLPDPWQLIWIIAPVFGWKHSTTHRDPQLAGTRIIRTLWVEVPRKNGKSTISSGFAIVLLIGDGELGAEVYAAATTQLQAGIVFDAGKKMIEASPLLREKVSAGKIEILTALVRVPRTGAILRALSRVAEAAHGLNVSGAVIDEVHVFKRRDLVDAIESGTGARDQPLVVFITTADEGQVGTIYAEKHDRCAKLAARTIKDPTFYGVIWAADEKDDPFSPKTWAKANPGLGTSVSLAYLRKEAERARTEPSYFPTFCRLHLNLRVRQTSRWLRMVDWNQPPNIASVDAAKLKGRECYAGLDLSATTDLTALVLAFPDDHGDELTVVPFFWLPEDGLDIRIERDQVPYDEWARNGFLELTEGNVVDYDKVTEKLEWARKTFDLREVGHDRWQAGPVVQSLTKLGITATPIPQTYGGMSSAAKNLERLVRAGRFVHGGHPVLRWNADCVEVIRDKDDNLRPVKPDRQKETTRVDGITAAVMAVDGWDRRPAAKPSPASAPPPQAAAAGGGGFFRPTGRLDV